MLNPKNNAAFLRAEVLKGVAKSFLENNFDNADDLPALIVPEDAKPLRGSLEKDREVVKQQCLAAMGWTPCEVDENAGLKEMAQKALARQTAERATVSVLPHACDACPKQRYTVPAMCHTCVARP